MRIKTRFYFYTCLLAAVMLLSGCGPKTRPGEEQKPAKKPYAIIYDTELSGRIFNVPLSDPAGLTSDNNGNIYLIDAGNSRLIKFDRNLEPVRETGGFGTSESLFGAPRYIVMDNNLNLYVADPGNQRISIYDSHLNYVDLVDLIDFDDPTKFGRPGGIAVNDYGELWVTEPDNSRVSVFDSNGEFNRFVGDVETYSGLLLTPRAAARGMKGQIMVSDEGRGSVYVFDSFGLYLFDFGYDIFKSPAGLDVDDFGNMWVTDSKLSALFCFDRDGLLLYSVGEYGATGQYMFNGPSDVTVLPGNRIAVSDTDNDRVMIYKIIYPE